MRAVEDGQAAPVDLPPRQRRRRQRRLGQPGAGSGGEQGLGQGEPSRAVLAGEAQRDVGALLGSAAASRGRATRRGRRRGCTGVRARTSAAPRRSASCERDSIMLSAMASERQPRADETSCAKRHLPAAVVAGRRRTGALGRGDGRARRPRRRPRCPTSCAVAAVCVSSPCRRSRRRSGRGWSARTRRPPHALSEEHELLAALESALPAAHAFVQHFSPTMLNALAFYWAGYRLELQYTYRLEGLGSEQALWDGPARQHPPRDPQGPQARGGPRRPSARPVSRHLGQDVRQAGIAGSRVARRARAPRCGVRRPRGEGDALRTGRGRARARRVIRRLGRATPPSTCSAGAIPSCAPAAPAAC
jgi:hypothetical protein